MIAEPTLEHYLYYLRQVEGDNVTTVRKRRIAFEQELALLLAHLERLSGQTTPEWEWPEESQDRHISQRIVRTDWLDNPNTGRSYFAAARTYGDVYWLQVGYSLKGQARPGIFAKLQDETWQPFDTDHLLGSSSYVCGIANTDADELAAQTLTAYIGDTLGPLTCTRRADDRATLYGFHAQPNTMVLFYADAACERWAGDTILNDIALRLELYKHKAGRQLTWCEENYPMLSGQERSLRGLLEKVNQASSVDPELLGRLIRLYRIFNGNLGMLTDRQATIGISLDNLDVVLKELEPLAEDQLLSTARDRLRQRQRQLEADLRFADQALEQADAAINALTAELGLARLVSLQRGVDDTDQVGLIEPGGFPGAQPLVESQMEAITLRSRPSQPVIYPRINAPPHIVLTDQDRALLQHIYCPGYDQVLVEKGFGGGYSGTRVLLTVPVTASGLRTARKVTKLGSALELRKERDNYDQHVGDFLPFCAAQVKRYYEQDDQAGLNYVFVGGGALGQVMDLEEYYRKHTAQQVIETLDALLDKELGQVWYGKGTPMFCFFAAEYGRHLVEHLRLRLRPASADALWRVSQSPAAVPAYRQIDINAIPREHEAIQPSTLLAVEGMVVRRIKPGEVKLEDPGGQGTIVRVEFALDSSAVQKLELGSQLGVRGEVVYNRRDRIERIARDAFPDLRPGISSGFIQLPGVPGMYPNPLEVYPKVLSRVLEGKRSYVHGDLHLRNVLVDEGGRGWLIDFARVEERHNLFDFIKLETYIRLMGLTSGEPGFSLNEYVQFEEALNSATLGERVTPPSNPELLAAYRVILAIRQIAQKYMGREPDFKNEYFPALFLYCLAVVKYYQKERPQPTRLVFATASVLSRYAFEGDDQARPSSRPPKGDGEPSRPEQPLGTGNRWAVLVGVDEYEDQANYGRLQVCVKDVEAICEQLIAGGFDPARIRMLTDHTAENPTRPNILTALKAVADATEPDDLLLFYYSGHGEEESGESYMVARDGRRLVLSDTAVPVSRIKEILEEAPARAKVIVLDACHSGADIDGKGPKPMSAEFIRRVFEEAEGLAILASCKQGQLSYEWREQGRSVFTHFFLEAFTGDADQDKKGFVTVQDASRHVTNGVKLWASQNNVSQTPTLQYTVAGDIILVRYY